MTSINNISHRQQQQQKGLSINPWQFFGHISLVKVEIAVRESHIAIHSNDDDEKNFHDKKSKEKLGTFTVIK